MSRRPCIGFVGIRCGRPTEGTRCPAHQRLEDARRYAKAVANGLHTAYWETLRGLRLQLAGGRCELRADAGCTGVATSVHLDESLEGDHLAATIDDVRAACAHCHGVVDGGRAAESRMAAA